MVAATEAGELGEITDASLAYLSLEDLLSELLDRIRAILAADTAAILLLDRDRDVLVARAAKGIEEEVRQGVCVPVGRGFAGRIAHAGLPVAIADVDHADLHNPLLRQKRIRSLLGVPIIADGSVVGVLHVGTLAPRTFDEHDTRLLQLAADRAASAIEGAQRSEQRALTEALQRRLLPGTLPQIPGLTLSAKYLPGGRGMLVGGDWYDVFALPGERVALVIGDVVGHGIGAASVMAEIRTALRAYAMQHADLDQVMSLLNAMVLGLGGKRSATLALLSLELESQELCAVSAGHPPAVLLGPDGRVELIASASGPPVGVRAWPRYSAEKLQFTTGSSLLLYTDGLIERRGEAFDEGLARLTHTVRGPGGDGQPLADRVFNELVGSQTPEDDVALLAVESRAIGDHLHVTLDTDPARLGGTRRVVARWLAEHAVPDQLRFDITTACSEAAANAIEHAYGPRHATLTLDGRITGAEVEVTVRDRGSWRPSSNRSRGRGLMIMEALVDHVAIERTGDGTTVTLRKRIA